MAPSDKPNTVRLLTVGGCKLPELPGGDTDRSEDHDWLAAAVREFEEEVNPAKHLGWSAEVAMTEPKLHITVRNLTRAGVRSWKRPCLTFLVARASDALIETMEKAEEVYGWKRLRLPETPYASKLPLAGAVHPRLRWSSRKQKMPFVEHDRCKWTELDLGKGTPSEKCHGYIEYWAKVLQEGSFPRSGPQPVEGLEDLLTKMAPREGWQEHLPTEAPTTQLPEEHLHVDHMGVTWHGDQENGRSQTSSAGSSSL